MATSAQLVTSRGRSPDLLVSLYEPFSCCSAPSAEIGVFAPTVQKASSGCSPRATIAWMAAEVASASVRPPRSTGNPPSSL